MSLGEEDPSESNRVLTLEYSFRPDGPKYGKMFPEWALPSFFVKTEHAVNTYLRCAFAHLYDVGVGRVSLYIPSDGSMAVFSAFDRKGSPLIDFKLKVAYVDVVSDETKETKALKSEVVCKLVGADRVSGPIIARMFEKCIDRDAPNEWSHKPHTRLKWRDVFESLCTEVLAMRQKKMTNERGAPYEIIASVELGADTLKRVKHYIDAEEEASKKLGH